MKYTHNDDDSNKVKRIERGRKRGEYRQITYFNPLDMFFVY